MNPASDNAHKSTLLVVGGIVEALEVGGQADAIDGLIYFI